MVSQEAIKHINFEIRKKEYRSFFGSIADINLGDKQLCFRREYIFLSTEEDRYLYLHPDLTWRCFCYYYRRVEFGRLLEKLIPEEEEW